jgi:hypothetical protein
MPYDFSINTMSVRFFPLWVVKKAGVLMFCLCYLYLLRNADVERDFNIICCSCRLTVTRCVALVDQELLTIHEHQSFHSGFWWGSCCAIFSFLCTTAFLNKYKQHRQNINTPAFFTTQRGKKRTDIVFMEKS